MPRPITQPTIERDGEIWVSIAEASKLTGLAVVTIRGYLKKGLFEWAQLTPQRKALVYINLSSIPTYMRRRLACQHCGRAII